MLSGRQPLLTDYPPVLLSYDYTFFFGPAHKIASTEVLLRLKVTRLDHIIQFVREELRKWLRW